MTAIAKRLRRLEERFRPALRSAAKYDPSLTAKLRERLAASGFIAGPLESLAEAWARAMGITCVELRAMLERRAGEQSFK